MFCPNCGNQIPDDSVFCENCGANLAAAQQPAQQTPYQQQPQMAQQQWQAQQPQYQQQYQQPQQQYVPQDDGQHKISIRTASLLCYWFSFVGWGVSYFLADNKDPYLRFHLNQSLIFWVIELVLTFIVRQFPYSILATLAELLIGVIFVFWLIAFIGACKNQTKYAPLFDKIPPILK